MDYPGLLPGGYRLDEGDAEVVVLRREDGSYVTAFSACGAALEAIRRASQSKVTRPGPREDTGRERRGSLNPAPVSVTPYKTGPGPRIGPMAHPLRARGASSRRIIPRSWRKTRTRSAFIASRTIFLSFCLRGLSGRLSDIRWPRVRCMALRAKTATEAQDFVAPLLPGIVVGQLVAVLLLELHHAGRRVSGCARWRARLRCVHRCLLLGRVPGGLQLLRGPSFFRHYQYTHIAHAIQLVCTLFTRKID